MGGGGEKQVPEELLWRLGVCSPRSILNPAVRKCSFLLRRPTFVRRTDAIDEPLRARNIPALTLVPSCKHNKRFFSGISTVVCADFEAPRLVSAKIVTKYEITIKPHYEQNRITKLFTQSSSCPWVYKAIQNY